MRVQHNITALNAYRNFNTNNSMLGANLEKLSSGYKINRAGDNAAGLAISEKMRAQITGLDVAQRNSKDGISLVQTAEGALTEVHDMLNRMYELAEQSANGTFADEVDREQLQKEVDQLRTEINRIADSANFNGIRLLDGSLSSAGKVANPDATLEWETVEPELSDDYMDFAVKPGDSADVDKINQTVVDTVDGRAPDGNAEAATFSFTTGDDTKKFKLNGTEFTVGTVTAQDLGALTINGAKLSELFTLKSGDANGTDVAWTSVDALDDVQQYTLVAVNKGALSDDIKDTLKAISDVDGGIDPDETEFVDGENLGHVTAATSAQYTMTLTFDHLQGETSFQIDGTKFEIKTDATDASDGAVGVYINHYGKHDVTIGATLDAEKNQAANLHQAQAMAFLSALESSDLADKYDFEISGLGSVIESTTSVTLKLTAKDAGPGAGNSEGLQGIAVGTDGVGITFEPGVPATGDDLGEYAQITYSNIDNTKLHAGDTLEIGGETITVVADDDTTADFTAGVLTETQAHDAATLASAFALQNGNAGPQVTIGGGTYGMNLDFSDGKLTVTLNEKASVTAYDSTVTSADASAHAAVDDLYGALDVTYTASAATVRGKAQEIKDNEKATADAEAATAANKAAAEEAAEKALAGKALTLQIGDTSDSFNQMEVEVNDMHTYNLGSKDADGNITGSLADVDISSQEGAAAACDILKDAINQVSDVRGTLGATQNRLEHTINNLGVMQENIQSAESVIRDTDVAEEMMKFTKNSIMNQAAQAMLAQANQLPQGVLQLLQ